MKKILLVEDDEMLCKSLAFFLKSNNFEVITYNNGMDAIEWLKNILIKPDLVITDLNLPFAGGRQVIYAIRGEMSQNIPIIVLTSLGMEAIELEVFDLGADEFITKPFSPTVLLKRIGRLIAA